MIHQPSAISYSPDNYKTIVVNKKGSVRIHQGLVWVFKSDIEEPHQALAGEIVRVVDRGANFLAFAFFSTSQLSLRIISRHKDFKGEALFVQQTLSAIAQRKQALFKGRDAYRLVHGEGDGFNGLLVDKYNDGLVLQSLTAAVDRLAPYIEQTLIELFNPRVMVWRNDGMTREYESLPDYRRMVRGENSEVIYHEGDLRLSADLMNDQKTGSFLDQYENHLLAGKYARGEVLDTFCYHGGFGLQMAKQATRVVCVDQSEQALQRAQQHAAANQLTQVEFVCVNAFDYMRQAADEKRQFDVVVVDPPAFAKRKSALAAALRGYKELNLRAMKIVKPGGILISCSCSAQVHPPVFEHMLIEAAQDAKRRAIILERRGASRDHSVLLGMVETEYLKCFILQL